jgi:hypothetical protein
MNNALVVLPYPHSLDAMVRSWMRKWRIHTWLNQMADRRRGVVLSPAVRGSFRGADDFARIWTGVQSDQATNPMSCLT